MVNVGAVPPANSQSVPHDAVLLPVPSWVIKIEPLCPAVSFEGLAPEFAQSVNADFIVRGLRAGYDFEYEFEMAHMWRNLTPDIDVVCMMSALEYQFVYSSRIKEVAKLGGNVDNLIPNNVSNALKIKLKK